MSEADVIYTTVDSIVVVEANPVVTIIAPADDEAVEVAGAGDSEVVFVTEAAAPIEVVAAEEAVTVIESIEVGPQGAQGVAGTLGTIVTESQTNFAWGDATPAILLAVAAGVPIYRISLVILEPFDGNGAALSIGVTGDADLFMAANECDPKTAGVYSVTPGYKFATAGTIRLFITPGAGASKGNGIVTIDY